MGEIIRGLQRLNAQTLVPMQYHSDSYEYYISGQDHALPHDGAVDFCREWGGNLLLITSEYEAQLLSDLFDKTEKVQWYVSKEMKDFHDQVLPDPVKENGSSDCLEYFTASKTLRYSADCDIE